MMLATNSSAFPILSAIIFAPLVGAFVVATLPKSQSWIARALGLVVSSGVFGLSMWLMFTFDKGAAGYQAIEKHAWVKDLGISYSLGIDGISVFLVVLTALLFPVAILVSESVKKNQRSFVASIIENSPKGPKLIKQKC